jgi:hypothetical protein
MTTVTDPITDPLSTPPPPGVDPDAYDSPRNARARAKGLEAPVISGGDDPNLAVALAADRRYGRWLVWMVVAIVASGFIIGVLIALAGPAGGR